MKPCKSQKQQIALLAVQALKESERAVVLEHLRECAACRAYAKELEGVVLLYAQDAQRPVPARATARQGRLAVPAAVPWYGKVFASRAALAAAAVLVVCTVLLVMNRTPHPDVAPAVPTVATVAAKSPMVPSIGNSRRLTAAELEDLTRPEPARSSPGTDFVFSVATRDDGS